MYQAKTKLNYVFATVLITFIIILKQLIVVKKNTDLGRNLSVIANFFFNFVIDT